MAEEVTLRKDTWSQLRAYFEDVRTEMKRVTWPSKQEVYGTTMMVILTTFAFALFFAICDYVFQGAVQWLLGRLLHHS
jgi:preprotein translocase subunit SecE